MFFAFFTPRGDVGVITSDFSGSGRFYTIDSTGFLSPNFIPIYSDAVGFYLDEKIILINRLGRDSIQFLDPNFLNRTILEFSTGKNSNPHGIAFYQNKAYITLYEKNYLLVVDKNTGLELKRIDLQPYVDKNTFSVPDNLPEASGIISYDNRIYVAIQRLDRTNPNFIFPPTDYSALLEVDPQDDVVIQEHRLIFTNPLNKLKIYNITNEDCIFVATPSFLGFNFRIDGGIEAFCPKSKQQFVVLTEQEVGGDILDFVIRDSQRGYALVLFQDFSNALVEFHPQLAKSIRQVLFYKNQEGFAAGLEIDENGILYLGESSAYPSVKIYNTNTSSFQGQVLLPQRPTDIFLLK
ncbi:MAG: hypothetical protein NZ853_08530 [Leptospiraceae bacterium]|nr:hypothetical protein [Leptospiraceae bacterium]MDW7976778.1 hypothetical protein [Leptospiraceae bacterium]